MKKNRITHSPIFISGPHGGGKSTLLNKLSGVSNLFLENNFDIDFTVDFPSLSSLSHFERSLIRLYHRFFIAHYANSLAKSCPDKFIITNRTIYDSEAYINVYRKLNWISKAEFETLDFVMKNFGDRPNAIILNPSLHTIKSRLRTRRDMATRTNRDKVFVGEDTDTFLSNLHNYFQRFKHTASVLYIKDNGNAEIKKIISWTKTL
ncbi:hypothetical protein A3G55_00320 [Candidatus Giovannonibacteria bacterium RIFCSPLOWO2_12_FULL_44_25]|uniref:Uncharacterized protein n=2 Tax=Candidatus Giovannoniibacteriota TaxID=1752738 RepID=A0A1F5WBV5_9BACT|nr:MAG: hypothetical protein UW05_C0022G0004 [Candidatus Giovannonibacteria bacterium GW2011_GWC2_43_8]KKT28075.1 MAG: hypothetical protein UW15_C0037G0004 [Parcubacteria group bacterium GW2011_GWC1_44_10]KKT59069.1 MAG: hypothetical protein UW53_C0023G0004 [Candidatus Giovannonibacteria bacterium GW2011_GWA1_44_25]KKU28841.1 MAG: hypothetical protein UX43_C0019G0004 [Candidatus Giovannonibacteria bacterium GW2011_GWB1_46_20]OGF49075.1 MAG: hypothetical protein A2120_03940 [Candidatus Giovannon